MAKNILGTGIAGNGEPFEVTQEMLEEYVLQITNTIQTWTARGCSFESVDRDGSWIQIWFNDEEGNPTSRTIGEGEFALPTEVIDEIITKVMAAV